MPKYNYKNDHYYTTNTTLNANGALVGAGASVIESFIDEFLEDGRGSSVAKSLKFLTKTGIFSNVISTTVEVVFNGDKVSIGGILIDLAADAALGAAITAALVASGVAPSLGVVLGVAAGTSLIISGAKDVWKEINLEFDSLYQDLLNGSLVDLKFINSSQNHTSGILFASESFSVLGVRGAINAYLANNSGNVDGGYLTFTDGRDGDQIGGEIYRLFNISAFQNVANKLGISLNQFLNLGTSGKTNNDIFYSGFNKIVTI